MSMGQGAERIVHSAWRIEQSVNESETQRYALCSLCYAIEKFS